MSASRRERTQIHLVRGRTLFFVFLLFLLMAAHITVGQEQISGTVQIVPTSQEHAHSETVTSLQDLLTEAEQNNPQIKAAEQGWQSAKQVPSQVSTLPDPQINVQQVNVGSPRTISLDTRTAISHTSASVSRKTSPIRENCASEEKWRNETRT